MQFSISQIADWITDPMATGLLDCRHQCDDYHILAPLLHRIGHFRSYEHYPHLVRDACHRLGKHDSIKALIVGTESEESVRAFLDTVSDIPIQIAIVDRCKTPLRRTSAAYACESKISSLIHLDIFDLPEKPEYDLIICDSFIKQFRPSEKIAVMRLLSDRLTNGGLFLIREYVGDLENLLEDFWLLIEPRLLTSGWFDCAPLEAQRALAVRVPRLQKFMLDVGSTFKDDKELSAALARARLQIKHAYRMPRSPHITLVCGRDF